MYKVIENFESPSGDKLNVGTEITKKQFKALPKSLRKLCDNLDGLPPVNYPKGAYAVRGEDEESTHTKNRRKGVDSGFRTSKTWDETVKIALKGNYISEPDHLPKWTSQGEIVETVDQGQKVRAVESQAEQKQEEPEEKEKDYYHPIRPFWNYAKAKWENIQAPDHWSGTSISTEMEEEEEFPGLYEGTNLDPKEQNNLIIKEKLNRDETQKQDLKNVFTSSDMRAAQFIWSDRAGQGT